MNLVQKLPIGLGLACLMIMSSCSKEDALTPQGGLYRGECFTGGLKSRLDMVNR